jgi:hypothetical protein
LYPGLTGDYALSQNCFRAWRGTSLQVTIGASADCQMIAVAPPPAQNTKRTRHWAVQEEELAKNSTYET